MNLEVKRHILFVDDEVRVLEGLKRMLRYKSSEWEMVFVDSGKKALEFMEKTYFDVIVSDIRMPEMDGTALLEKVHKFYPQTVRIILSGHAEINATFKAINLAHQFLLKPCDSAFLVNVIERSCNVQNLLFNETLRSMIHQIKGLPSQPRLYSELNQALIDPQISLKKIAEIVEQDTAMSAKVLQLVNSAFFSFPQRVTNIHTAVSCLGVNMIKMVSLSVEIFRCFTPKINSSFSFEDEQLHAFLTACIAKNLIKDKQKAEDAFMAGLLHDVGKLILADQLPEQLNEILTVSSQSKKTFVSVERDLYQVTHAEIGAYLLGLWGLPYPVVEAVAFHHKPQVIPQVEFDVLSAIYVANILARKSAAHMNKGAALYAELDADYLASVGVVDQVDEWEISAKLQAENVFGVESEERELS